MSKSGMMSRVKWAIIAMALIGAGLTAARYFSESHDHEPVSLSEHEGHGLTQSVDEQGNVVWTCSMHPQIQLPEPGKCPICFMDLIKLEIDANKADAVSLRQVELDTTARKLAEIVVAPVVRQSIAVDVRMVGKVDYDEARVASITAWMGGRIDKMYVDSTGSVVKRGQPMASIYSPELLTAQAELIQAVRAMDELKGSSLALVQRTAKRTLEAAKEKLRLLGLSKRQIEGVIARGKPSDHITLHASQSGIVIRKEVVEGMYVKTGQPIYTVADLSRVWVVLGAYESDLPWIKEGQKVEFQAEAYPGQSFTGKIIYIDPTVNEKSRTVDVRLEVPNAKGKLKPGMFVQATQRIGSKTLAESGQVADDPLVIPVSAPLITGKRAVVYVAVKGQEGVYEGREVVLGPRAGDFYVVKSGLAEGESVVSKGSFKIDSALQIMAKPSMMNPNAGVASAVHDHSGHGATGTSQDSAAMELPAKYDVPEVLVSKLYFVSKELESVAEALRRRDVEAGKALYASLRDKMTTIDASVQDAMMLEGDAKLEWRELSMLFINDCVLGSEVRDYKRLHEIYALTLTHFDRMRTAFGVTAYGRVAGLTIAAPDAFKKQIGAVYTAYAPLSEALGNDDLAAARNALSPVTKALSAVNMSELSDTAHAVWMKNMKRMTDGLTSMRSAPSLLEMRVGFEPLSIGLTETVTKLGVIVDGPIYKLTCPMAFEDKGASWLQQDEDIRNPYFGAAMYKCGEVSSQLKAQ